jgi:hypothetical protein
VPGPVDNPRLDTARPEVLDCPHVLPRGQLPHAALQIGHESGRAVAHGQLRGIRWGRRESGRGKDVSARDLMRPTTRRRVPPKDRTARGDFPVFRGGHDSAARRICSSYAREIGEERACLSGGARTDSDHAPEELGVSAGASATQSESAALVTASVDPGASLCPGAGTTHPEYRGRACWDVTAEVRTRLEASTVESKVSNSTFI